MSEKASTKKISILGSTGSIGVSALEVIQKHPQRFSVTGLAAGRNVDLLQEQILRFKPDVVAVLRQEDADRLSKWKSLPAGTEVFWGPTGYEAVATFDGSNMVISAMVGAAGLVPTLEAIESGKDIALANKETLVMAGRIVMERARLKGVRVLPVDSEHSAVFQCLCGQRSKDVRRIILTASGGPFLHVSKEKMSSVSVEEALNHPNWKMGRKITIDSATMMNKGLEVIEAHWLFAVEIDRIQVHIHPQSIVHSMVEFIDGSVMAQLGVPDMKGPIAYALSYPERLSSGGPFLDLLKAGKLEFIPPDMEKFPCLRLAYEAIQKGGTMPAVLNAANEISVSAFLSGDIGFGDMPAVIEKTLSDHRRGEARTLGEVLEADRWARVRAQEYIEGIKLSS